MVPEQKPPQRIDAPSPGSNPATFIFLHGFGDDADGWTNVAQQFHSAHKLPHLTWLFPNAPHNHEAMTTAWYTPTTFSPIPVGRSTSCTTQEEEEEDGEFEEEGEQEIFDSVAYVEGLIEKEVERGVPLSRIIIGGFSQGCAISLVTGLAGKFQGRIGGVVGLSGYLPRGKGVREGRNRYRDVDGKVMRIFLAHGTKDMLVPMRVFRDAKGRIAGTVGEEEDGLEVHEYEGLGHGTRGDEFRDLCGFLERVAPA